MRYRAVVEYDGSAYSGFQFQKGQLSVQENIEKAISTISGTKVGILAAGRTDSGVHAKGQVIAFDLDWDHGSDKLLRAVNSNLADDIVLRSIDETGGNFHPRFDAISRIYQYYIYNGPVRSPMKRYYSWHVMRPLDLEAMNEAARAIIGQHDFATFGQAPQGVNTVREVFAAQWQRRNTFMIFTIEANAFLYRMVRSLVGTMKVIGDGSWSLEQFHEAFRAQNRGRAGQTAPARGVFLKSVRYE